MKRTLPYLAILMLIIIAVPEVSAEDTEITGAEILDTGVGSIVRIKTTGGGEFQGTLLSLSEDRVELIDGEGQIVAVALAEIREVAQIDIDEDSSGYFQDAAANRLLIMPTAFGMETGEFHIAVQEFVVVTAAYGVSSNFSLWGGVSFPGAILSARYSFGLGRAGALSFGSFAGFLWLEPMAIVMPYAVYSTGNPNQNFTVGGAVPFTFDSGGMSFEGILVALAGKIVLSRTASFITENWVLLGTDGGRFTGLPAAIFPSIAFRIAGSRFSWDVGVTLPLRVFVASTDAGGLSRKSLGGLFGDDYIPLPIVSFTYRIR